AVYDHYSGTLTLVANVVNVDGAETGIDDAYASGVARIEAMLARITAPAPAEVRVPEAVTPQVRTRTPRETYLEGVRRAKQDIVDGEIFQVVLG
ncbi:anthranilate synthase component I, partial [Mycobacterium tuberculosis]|nr:anthranilate synthase component I [Mycobacterium tuberculosis]